MKSIATKNASARNDASVNVGTCATGTTTSIASSSHSRSHSPAARPTRAIVMYSASTTKMYTLSSAKPASCSADVARASARAPRSPPPRARHAMAGSSA